MPNRRYRHPALGQFHRLNLSEGSISTYFVSDAELASLTKYLSHGEKRGKRTQVLQLFHEMLALQNLNPPVWDERKDGPMTVTSGGRPVINPSLKKRAPDKYKLLLELSQRQGAIRKILVNFSFFPIVHPIWGNDRWAVSWRPLAQVGKQEFQSALNITDSAAVQLILDFARAGTLGRLRQCRRCSKWLYAKFEHQNFCSTSCQQKHYARSEDWRAKRREYMRGYRRLTMGGRKK